MDRISIVFCSDDNFAQHSAVTMRSIVEHCSRPADIDFYYIHDGISEEKQVRLRRTIEGFGATLTFLTPDVSVFKDAFINHYYSLASYFRLLVPSCLPQEVHRCLYLDGDMVVDGDVAELWATDLEGHPLGAVPDLGVMLSLKRTQSKATELGIPPEAGYFNSGLLLIDLEAWRRERYADQAAELALSRPLKSHDQDALNAVFTGRWTPIDFRWNKMPAVYGFSMKLLLHAGKYRNAIEARKRPGILHYASRHKPWKARETVGFSTPYYDVLRRTAFADCAVTSDAPAAKSERLRIALGRILYSPFESSR